MSTVARSGPGRLRITLERLLVVVVFLSTWWLVSATLVPVELMSNPGLVAGRLGRWVADGAIWPHLGATLREALQGYAWGATLGIAVGLVLGLSRFLGRVFDPLITGLYALPKISFAPMLILFLGIGEASKIALAAIIVFFFVFYNTLHGVRAVDPELQEPVLLMGGTRWTVFRRVTLPSTWEWTLDGLKIAVPSAFIGAVGGEIIVSQQGLGFLIRESARTLDVDGVLAAILVIVVLSVSVNALVNWGRSRAGRWRSEKTVL